MTDKIEEKVETLFKEGKTRKETIAILLEDNEEKAKVLFYANNISMPAARKKYQVHNLALSIAVALLTLKKLVAVFSYGSLDLVLLLSLVVPVINIYLLREILKFRKIGYQFMLVLAVLSIPQPENHAIFEAVLLCIIISLSGLLYFRIFPKKEQATYTDER